MTMNKPLILAAFATALSLGAASAMANDSLGAKNPRIASCQTATQAMSDYRAATRTNAPTWNDAGTGMVGGFDAGG
jgi:hypothetical protein